MKKYLGLTLALTMSMPTFADHTVINGLEFGPLAQFVGEWKSVDAGGVDISPAQEGSGQAAGMPAVTPFYETMTIEVAADAINASKQTLVALYYKQEVFRKKDDTKFHDQRGYLIYDAENQVVYNSFCVPRTTCVTAESPAGSTMNFVLAERGVAESNFMQKNASTTAFTMTLSIDGDKLSYTQNTGLSIYGQQVVHTDTSTLMRVK